MGLDFHITLLPRYLYPGSRRHRAETLFENLLEELLREKKEQLKG